MHKFHTGATLTGPAGDKLTIRVSDTATYSKHGTDAEFIPSLLEAGGKWAEIGGDEDEFTSAVFYIDSLR